MDVVFDLENNTYKPFIKPNNIPIYVHRLSNHPLVVTKNIPPGINKRLSSISSSEEMFESIAPIYREALEKSGYSLALLQVKKG